MCGLVITPLGMGLRRFGIVDNKVTMIETMSRLFKLLAIGDSTFGCGPVQLRGPCCGSSGGVHIR